MKDLLLIKKIQAKDESRDFVPVTFDLDESFEKSLAMGIFDELNKKNIIKTNRFTIREHSFTIEILPISITRIIEEIIKRGLYIYGVYTLYDNYLEEGELK